MCYVFFSIATSLLGAACFHNCDYIGKGRKAFHTIFFFLYVIGAALASFLVDWSVSFFTGSMKSCRGADNPTLCYREEAFFRFMTTQALFYFLHLLLTNLSHYFNNSFWCFKIMFLLIASFSSLFVPDIVVEYYFHAALVLSTMYLLMQVCILVNASLTIDKGISLNSKIHKCFYVLFSLLFIASGSFCHYLSYTQFIDCRNQKVVYVLSLFALLISSILSVAAVRRTETNDVSLLSLSFVFFYTGYNTLCLLAATGYNHVECNPIDRGSVIWLTFPGIIFPFISAGISAYISEYDTDAEEFLLKKRAVASDDADEKYKSNKAIVETPAYRKANVVYFSTMFLCATFISIIPTLHGATIIVTEKVYAVYFLALVNYANFAVYPIYIGYVVAEIIKIV